MHFGAVTSQLPRQSRVYLPLLDSKCSPAALCQLQLVQPCLETIPGENFTDIESNSSVSEDAAEAASGATPEPPVRYITYQDPSCVMGRCLPACAKIHVIVCMPGKRRKACY